MEINSGSPWNRKCYESRVAYTIRRHSDTEMDIDSKLAALKASPCVVSVVTYKGGKMMFPGSGTIIDCEEVNGTYTSTILTSATLFRSSPESKSLQDDMKVKVYLADGKSFEGHVSAHDFYFNIVTISITSDVALPIACLRLLDDSISFYPTDCNSNSFKLGPGDIVIAIGRSCDTTHELMVTAGKFSLESYEFDCGELFKSSCIIPKCGFGGPLINRDGEVIGVNFYDKICTPFLPVNIVSRCLKQFRENRESRRPWLGMELTNLYAASVGMLEKVLLKFSICKGVYVDEVITESPAEQAGILYGDVIVQCGGKDVQSFLEFYDIIWEKVRETVEVVVIRESSAARLILKLFVDETSPDKLNRWPVPEEYKASVKRARLG